MILKDAREGEELAKLRVRCGKIDEIEKCALLLVEKNEQLKAQLTQTHLELAHLKLAQPHQQHRAQLELSHQLKMLSAKLHDEQRLRESVTRENQQLKTRVHELQQQVRSTKHEAERAAVDGNRAAAEANRYSSGCKELELKAQQQLHHILELEAEFKAARADNEQLLRALESAETNSLSLERMNQQLRTEGAALIHERQNADAALAQLQHAHAQQAAAIHHLTAQLEQLHLSNQLQDQKAKQVNSQAEAAVAAVQQDNMRLKCQIHAQAQEIATKQQEIEDLIAITGQLEQQAQRHALSATDYQQTAAHHHAQLQQLRALSETQIQQLALHTRNEQRLQAAIEDLHHQALVSRQAMQKREETLQEQLLIAQQQKQTQHQQKDLQIQQLRRQLAALEEEVRLSQQRQRDEHQQLQQLYLSEKQRNELLLEATSKERQQNVILQQEIIEARRQFEQEMQLRKQNEGRERQEQLQCAMQQMEELVSQKYDQILQQYKEHFSQQLLKLQQQVAALSPP